MDYKELRIKTDIGVDNKHINFKLDQEFDNINILSLKLTQTDIYNTFNSNYGCVVGRVIANGGVGIPNAKISIFIPLSDEDNLNEEIKAIYPYKSPEDLDLNGYKYNLLPRVSQVSPFISTIINENNVGYTPKTPVGTFPTKEEILTNDILLDVYKKYYKYTTVTNESGDYMIFGVPVGTHFIHMSVDITDIGKYSMTPATMVKLLGFSENLFENNGTSIRKTNDLDDLPNIQLQNISIDVRPFWGDQENFEIGITRQDFKIKAKLLPTFTIFGSIVTMGVDGLWGISKSPNCGGLLGANTCLFYTINNYDDGDGDISGFNVENFRQPKTNAEIYTIKNTISDEDITLNNFNINNDILRLRETDYTEFIENGMFVYLIPCNRTKIITNEFGIEEVVDNDNPNGVFTEFNGYVLMDTEELPIQGNTNRDGVERTKGPFIRLKSRFKIPQGSDYLIDAPEETPQIQNFIKKNRKFRAGDFYTTAQFYSISYATGSGSDIINSDLNRPKYRTLGIIQTSESFTDTIDPNDPDAPQEIIRSTTFPSNTNQSESDKYFGSQWVNMCLFQIQFAATDRRRDNRVRTPGFLLEDSRSANMFFINDNIQNLGGGRFNSKGFISARYHYFDFVKVDREDIIKMTESNKKIFRPPVDNLTSEYKYTPNNNVLASLSVGEGGNLIGRDLNNSGAYVYKGLNQSDCINYLNTLNLI